MKVLKIELKNIYDEFAGGSLKENETAISEIKSSGAGFSFTYYQFINSTLYSIDYENGILGEVEVVYKAEKN